MEITSDILKRKLKVMESINVDILKVLNIYNSKGIKNLFYESYITTCTQMEKDVLYELMNINKDDFKSLEGFYSIYDHCIQNTDFDNFLTVLSHAISKSEYIKSHFSRFEISNFPKRDKTKTVKKGDSYSMSIIKEPSYLKVVHDKVSVANMLKNYKAVLLENSIEWKFSLGEKPFTIDVKNEFVREHLIFFVADVEEKLRNGNVFKSWYIANSLGTEEDGLFADYRTLNVDNLTKFIEKMLLDNIIIFLSFINYTATDFGKMRQMYGRTQLKYVYVFSEEKRGV